MSEQSKHILKKTIELGAKLGFTKANLYKIEQRGFWPPKHHSRLIKAAQEFGVSLTQDQLDSLKSSNQ